MNEAINKTSGVCVILAGAGTGKTHTIVEKMKFMIRNKVYAPEKIVCITFSNEAANNLILRTRKEMNLQKEPIIRTFHGFSADLLREQGDKIGIDKSFKILDSDEAKVVLHRNMRVPAALCHSYISSIGAAKDLGITLEEMENYVKCRLNDIKCSDIEKKFEELQFKLQTFHIKKEGDKEEISEEAEVLKNTISMRKFMNAWKAYEKLKKAKNYQDYSDLNANALKLLKENPEIAKQFDYIIVDEFQDTNKIQLDLLIAMQNNNITVVGDMNQSIYRFRGAYKENFNNFKEHFNVEKKDIFALDKSWRSPDKVLRAAHKLIINNYSSEDEIFCIENYHKREGERISAFELKNSKEEARKVVEIVESEIEAGTPVGEICVLFRTHQQGRIIKRALEMKGIPFISVSRTSLLKVKPISSVVNYLHIGLALAKNEGGGDEYWWNAIYEQKFSEHDLITIGAFLKANKESENISKMIISSVHEIGLTDEGNILMNIICERAKKISECTSKNASEAVVEAYKILGLLNEGQMEEEKEAAKNLGKFCELVIKHAELYSPDLESFLHYTDILNNLGIEIEAADSAGEGVNLMTLHATKGLEYKAVIITNLAQKRFPMERYSQNPLIPVDLSPELKRIVGDLSKDEKEEIIKEYEAQNQLFDERRLCYVAFTRAKERLYLTYAREYGGKKFEASQFLKEVEYDKNPDFVFEQDMEEKFKEPELLLKKANAMPADNAHGKKEMHFSPSALLLFDECQKSYEYKYVYNMPERKSISWEAMRMGSFVHLVLEEGVKRNLKKFEDFSELVKELMLQEDWETIDIDEAIHLVKVFFERNKDKYNEKSKTEQFLKTKINGFDFVGFADRIDYSDKGLEIIDYKTGKAFIAPKHRNWQLGYYAIAARNNNLGKVRKITLEMLKQDKPIEFEVSENGFARGVNFNVYFNINEVEKEIAETAQKVIDAYKHGFKPCAIEKNCEFCNEFVYAKN